MKDFHEWTDMLIVKDVEPVRPLRETLAEYSHGAWSGWMKYMFRQCRQRGDGSVVIPADLVTRWLRQMHTEYNDLPEGEKGSDRKEADAIVNAMGMMVLG